MKEKKTKQKQVEPGPAERIRMMTERVPSFDEMVASLDRGPLERQSQEQVLADHARDIEQKLLERSASILSGALRFYEVDEPDPLLPSPEPPREWIDQYGAEEAKRMLRLAHYAQRSTRDSPVGTHYARDLYLGILAVRAKRAEAEQPRQLNVAITQINVAPPPRYPELEVGDGRKTRRM